MDKKSLEDYNVEDFITDESFMNYHFRLNDDDRLFWEDWLTNNPSKKEVANEASRLIESLSLTLTEKEFNEEFKKIETAINKKQPLSIVRTLNWNKPSKTSLRKIRRLKYMLVGLMILAIGATFVFTVGTENKKEDLTKTITSHDKAITFILSDSTVVALAPNSSLQYQSPFQGTNRQVYLDGEASFNVKRNEAMPFKVHTKNIVATVLGTLFNITKPGDSAIVIRLLEGKLKVEIEDSSITTYPPILLLPEEKAVYVFQNRQFYKNSSSARFSLSFHQSSFEEIATRIKNVFGVSIINQSSKKNWRFTGEFTNASVKEIIENICLVKNLSSTEKGDTIIILNKN